MKCRERNAGQFIHLLKHLFMKSTIRIEMDFNSNEPVLEIRCDANSPDLRDKTLKHFLDSFGGDSSWAKFNFLPYSDSGYPAAQLRPITRGTFPTEAEAMLEQHRLNVQHNITGTPIKAAKYSSSRRNRLDLMHPSEKAIYTAMQEVEKTGADIRLTNAINLLSEAKDNVSDFLDEKEAK